MNAELEHILTNEWQRWSDEQPQLLRPLDGGLTNRSYLIEAGGETLVLRINAPNSEALDLDRVAEADALQRANPQNLCAPLVYLDPNHHYLLTRFIEDQSLEPGDPDALAKIAGLLRKIHQLPPISARLNIASKASHYWQSIDKNTPCFPALAKLHELMQPMLQSDGTPQSVCLCHNDLLPGNLLLDQTGQLRAIDWEYAACGDPYFDLATVAQGYGLNRQQQQSLVSEYLQRPASNADLQRLDHWQRIYRYIAALWYAVQNFRCIQTSTSPMNNEALCAEITDLLATFD